MLLQPISNNDEIIKAIQKIIESFWTHFEFYLNMLMAVIGIFFGVKAWKEAGRAFGAAEEAAKDAKKAFEEAGLAKVAANAAETASKEASKKVHKQDIIIILTEILNECDLNQSIEYPEAESKHTFIHKKICNIKGLYEKYLDSTQIEYLKSIEANLVSIRTSVDSFNYALNIGNNVTNTPGLIYLTIVSPFSTLSGNIELLKGSLQSTLFE